MVLFWALAAAALVFGFLVFRLDSMAQVTFVFAELDRALIAQRTSDALKELRSQGKAYGPTPFGYRRVSDRLIEHADEQRVIKRIHRLRKNGHSYDRIARTLNGSGVVSKRGGSWYPMSVRSVLMTTAKLAGNA